MIYLIIAAILWYCIGYWLWFKTMSSFGYFTVGDAIQGLMCALIGPVGFIFAGEFFNWNWWNKNIWEKK